MPEKEVFIKKADLTKLDNIFRLYKHFMFDSYLLRFGNSFVKEYLKIIITSKDCISFIAEDKEAGVVGFIMSTLDSKRMMLELFFNTALLNAWVRNFFLRPCLAVKSIELCCYPFRTSMENVNAEFLFIAVEPAYRKMNLATNLIKETIDSMSRSGIKRVKVSIVSENNAVDSLLKKLGFKVEKSFNMFKKKMRLYIN